MNRSGRRMTLLAALILPLMVQCVSVWSAQLFADSFDRAEIGPRWKVVDDPFPSGPSDWHISSGALVQTNNIYRSDDEYEFWQGSHIVTGSASWRDYVLSAEVTSTDDDGWGLIVRYQDPSNFYRFITVADTGNGGPFCRLEKFVDGKRILLAEEKKAFEVGKPTHVKLAAKDGKLALWLDDKINISAYDKTFDTGKAGFLVYANTGLSIRKVVVESLDDSVVPAVNEPIAPSTGPEVSFLDTFDRADIGPDWTVVDDPDPAAGPSYWRISGGTLRQDSNIYRAGEWEKYFQGTHIVAGSTGWRDYQLSALVKSDDDDGWGLIVRYQDPKNYYRFITVADSANSGPFMRIDKTIDGTPTVLVSKRAAYTPGKAYQVRFRASGAALEVWIDDEMVLTTRDDALKSGKFGFMTYADSGCSFDNVKVVGAK